ncbi:MAG: RNA binding S1 domain protein [Candidatus Azambacteria bacterium GW2011_GWB1_42_17]|uniref:RNA binding S1 domain protein n=4 Tax=Parcubacteria group TaxID=1794811 RepID=A0A0G0ZAA7_9BACT|nr:MAG: RNA binding S1 domain protein [Candidatus Azambacteria bacterium GW2011_GWB1_42_17]KKS45615.1 MAG: RNA binding S1 domain protein [Candidatus Azambacteria bacterium GW2011_GWA1_42_19]
MIETQSNVLNMQTLAMKLPKAFNAPKSGDVIEGRVIKKNARNLYVDLGIWGIGIVYGIEFTNAQSIIKNLKIGDSIFAKISEIENEDGLRELSLAEAQSQKSWDLIRELKKTNKVVAVKILNVNRGGLMIEISGVAGFLPVSQLSSEHYPRVEGGDKNKILEELSKFVGEDFKVRVLDFDIKENKLIVSEKAADEEHLKEAVGRHQVGDIVAGTISGIVDWGAFIKWPAGENALEGLIHISELDWQLIENPADFVKVGDGVKAQIIDIMNDRISLSLKRLKPDPWKTASASVEKGMIVDGLVNKFNPFGAFVEVAYGNGSEVLQGLCHISEFGSEEKMKNALAVGKRYQFKILAFVTEEHRMSLGLFKEEEKI